MRLFTVEGLLLLELRTKWISVEGSSESTNTIFFACPNRFSLPDMKKKLKKKN